MLDGFEALASREDLDVFEGLERLALSITDEDLHDHGQNERVSEDENAVPNLIDFFKLEKRREQSEDAFLEKNQDQVRVDLQNLADQVRGHFPQSSLHYSTHLFHSTHVHFVERNHEFVAEDQVHENREGVEVVPVHLVDQKDQSAHALGVPNIPSVDLEDL